MVATRRRETRIVALVVDASLVHRASDVLLGARRQTLGEHGVLVDKRVHRDVVEHELRQAEFAVPLGRPHEPAHHRVAGPNVVALPCRPRGRERLE